jgi:hypothetical protein
MTTESSHTPQMMTSRALTYRQTAQSSGCLRMDILDAQGMRRLADGLGLVLFAMRFLYHSIIYNRLTDLTSLGMLATNDILEILARVDNRSH